MATHSSIFAWRILWTEELERVGHNTFIFSFVADIFLKKKKKKKTLVCWVSVASLIIRNAACVVNTSLFSMHTSLFASLFFFFQLYIPLPSLILHIPRYSEPTSPERINFHSFIRGRVGVLVFCDCYNKLSKFFDLTKTYSLIIQGVRS